MDPLEQTRFRTIAVLDRLAAAVLLFSPDGGVPSLDRRQGTEASLSADLMPELASSDGCVCADLDW
jgi:hypothetical protein